MVELTEETLATLKTEHGRVKVARYTDPDDGDGWTVVLRMPKGGEFDMFTSNASDERRKAQSQKVYFRQLCVWPTGVELESLLDKWKGIPQACSEEIMSLSGMVVNARAK